MQFEYMRRSGGQSPVIETTTFQVEYLRQGAFGDAPATDISDIIDRTYEYHSPRELRWHLAQRLGMSPTAVSLSEAG